MIRSFKCKYTKALSKGQRVKRIVNITNVARRKLRQLEIANRIEDLKVPPGNHLEALKGDRSGQHSIRINIISGVSAFVGRMQVRKMWK